MTFREAGVLRHVPLVSPSGTVHGLPSGSWTGSTNQWRPR
jgi:hypothetical protein